MKVKQYQYLSPEANKLRQRDGTRPWGVHVCELESFGEPAPDDGTAGAISWRESALLRDQIEGSTAWRKRLAQRRGRSG